MNMDFKFNLKAELFVKPRDTFEVTRQIRGYTNLIKHYEDTVCVQSWQYPFLYQTGIFESWDWYKERIYSRALDIDVILSLIVTAEIEEAISNDNNSIYPYDLKIKAEEILVDHYLSYGGEDQLHEDLEYIMTSPIAVSFVIDLQSKTSISDVLPDKSFLLEKHHFHSDSGQLQFCSEFNPQDCAQDVDYVMEKTPPKNGQRKLFCDFLSTLEWSRPKTVIYLGAYPGAGIDCVAEAHPHIQFYFSDLKCPIGTEYAKNVTWFKRIEEITFDKDKTLFYSDIYDGDDTSRSFFTQLRYAEGIGAKFNSLKRLISWSEAIFHRVKGSRLCHQPWRGASGELRERFILEGDVELSEFSTSIYERHVSYVDNYVRSSRANVRSKWTGCSCHDCKIFQYSLEECVGQAVTYGTIKKFLAKVRKRLSGYKEKTDSPTDYELSEVDIFGMSIDLADTTIHRVKFEPMVATLYKPGGVFSTYASPGFVFFKGIVSYNLNGQIWKLPVESSQLPVGVRAVLKTQMIESYPIEGMVVSVLPVDEFHKVGELGVLVV